MANKKIKECENIEFLPQKFQEELKEQSDKNILSTLCYNRFRFSDYAKAHGGFFFTSLEELAKESLVDNSTVKRRLALLQMKKYIDRKSGTNHQCTHYKLSKEIEQLLGIEDDEYPANAPLDKIREDKTSLDKKSSVKTRLDETSKDKLSIEQTSTDKLSTDNKYFQEFKGFVDENLVGENEGELINKRVEISNNLKKKELEIGKTMCNRCSSYLNRKFEEAVASI